MSYSTTRRLVLAVGLWVLVILAFVLYVRRVETVEVLAVLLFIPVFVGFLWKGIVGGLGGGVAASAAYLALRVPAIRTIGVESLAGLLAARTAGYVAFGVLGGWAEKQLRASLQKLDIYDEIDDATGLHNARSFLHQTNLEMARAVRYHTFFSVCVVDVPASAFGQKQRRRGAGLLREVGTTLANSVRNVDHAVHAALPSVHRFAVVCPETGPEGARVFAERLGSALSQLLRDRGIDVPAGGLSSSALSFPGDEGPLEQLREEMASVDAAEHPEHATRPRPPST